VNCAETAGDEPRHIIVSASLCLQAAHSGRAAGGSG